MRSVGEMRKVWEQRNQAEVVKEMKSDEREVVIIIWRTRNGGRRRWGCRSRMREERQGTHVRDSNVVYDMTQCDETWE